MSRVINLTHLGSDTRIPTFSQPAAPTPVARPAVVNEAAWNEYFFNQAGINQWRTGH